MQRFCSADPIGGRSAARCGRRGALSSVAEHCRRHHPLSERSVRPRFSTARGPSGRLRGSASRSRSSVVALVLADVYAGVGRPVLRTRGGHDRCGSRLDAAGAGPVDAGPGAPAGLRDADHAGDVPPGHRAGSPRRSRPWGALLDTMQWRFVNGFPYMQPRPFDAPGPDGPKTPEQLGAEIGRRAGVAAAAFEQRIWRDVLRRWDDEVKPASIATHRALADVDLPSLDDAGCSTSSTCDRWLTDMATSTIGTTDGDGAGRRLRAARREWTPAAGPDVHGLRRMVAGVGHRAAGAGARRRCAAADPEALALLDGDAPAAERLPSCCRRVPEVDEYVPARVPPRRRVRSHEPDDRRAARPRARSDRAASTTTMTLTKRAEDLAAELRGASGRAPGRVRRPARRGARSSTACATSAASTATRQRSACCAWL